MRINERETIRKRLNVQYNAISSVTWKTSFGIFKKDVKEGMWISTSHIERDRWLLNCYTAKILGRFQIKIRVGRGLLYRVMFTVRKFANLVGKKSFDLVNCRSTNPEQVAA